MKRFEFLETVARYDASPSDIDRLNTRHRFLIDPFAADLAGARVLDLGAHDGRWSYALAQAGAAKVVGIEARQSLIDRFAQFPAGDIHDRIELRQGDLHEHLHMISRSEERFDVVALFGIMYHVMDHFSIILNALRTGANLIIIDSEFMRGANPYIQLTKEDTSNDLNAASQIDGQRMALKGTLSSVAMERIAEALDCSIEWQPWNLPPGKRTNVGDYYRPDDKKMLRRTCALRPWRSLGQN